MDLNSLINVLPIKIDFNVSETVKRFVYVYAIIGQKIYLVDAGVAGTLDQIGEALKQIGRSLDEVAAVMLTHTHPDHIGNVARIKQVLPGCKVYAPANESAWIENIDIQYEERPIPNFYVLAGASVQPDMLVAAGDTICLEDNIHLDVIDCAGHSHGSVGYYWPEKWVFFSGDAIPVPNDAPIFSSLDNSLATVERIGKLDSVDVMFSAWDVPRERAEIAHILSTSKELLTTLLLSVRQVCQGDDAYFLSIEEKQRRLCETCGFAQYQNHPLFIRSVAAAFHEYYDRRIKKAEASLHKRGFDVITCTSTIEVRETVINLLGRLQPKVIGFGNSLSVRACDITELAQAATENVYQHAPRHFSADDDRQAMLSDMYFSSVNALSEDGCIVNIDGTGNRTGATCFGPKNVVYIVGRNKIATGGLDAALRRAKAAAVRLATIYERNTPCAKTGFCCECLSDECVCGVTTIHRKALRGNTITIILVNDDLGL